MLFRAVLLALLGMSGPGRTLALDHCPTPAGLPGSPQVERLAGDYFGAEIPSPGACISFCRPSCRSYSPGTGCTTQISTALGPGFIHCVPAPGDPNGICRPVVAPWGAAVNVVCVGDPLTCTPVVVTPFGPAMILR